MMQLHENSFFIPGAEISIEARGPAGSPRDVKNRQVVTALQRLSAFARKTVAGALLVAGATGAIAGQHGADVAGDSHDHHAEHHAAQLVSPELINQWRQQALDSFQSDVKPRFSLRMDDRSSREVGNFTPTALFNPSEAICHVSLVNLDSTLRSAQGETTSEDARRRGREFIVMHEAAHCEAMAQMMLDSGKSVPSVAKQVMDHHQEIARAATAFSKNDVDLVKPLSTLTFEKQADAKALLHFAHRSLNDAVSQPEIEAGLREFDAYVEEARRLRHGETESTKQKGTVFHDHDSIDVVEAVQVMVHAGVKDLHAFKRQVLNPDQAGDVAWQLALGSVRSTLPQIQKALVDANVAKNGAAMAYVKSEETEVQGKLSNLNLGALVPMEVVNSLPAEVVAGHLQEARKTLEQKLEQSAGQIQQLSEQQAKLANLSKGPFLSIELIGIPEGLRQVAAQSDRMYAKFAAQPEATPVASESLQEAPAQQAKPAPRTNGSYLMGVLGVKSTDPHRNTPRPR